MSNNMAVINGRIVEEVNGVISVDGIEIDTKRVKLKYIVSSVILAGCWFLFGIMAGAYAVYGGC